MPPVPFHPHSMSHTGVQARVSSAADWIDENVCELSVDPPKDFECHKRMRRHSKAPTTQAPVTTSPTVAPLPAPVATTVAPTIRNATTPPTLSATTAPTLSEEHESVVLPVKPVRSPVFVPTSVLVSCITVVLGIALVVYLGMNWYYMDRRYGSQRCLIPQGQDVTTAYGSTDS